MRPAYCQIKTLKLPFLGSKLTQRLYSNDEKHGIRLQISEYMCEDFAA
jgi:hypothetical protein